MGRMVEFDATVEQLAKTGDKPTKVVLSMGDEHASEVLALVGERVTVTLESKQEQIVVDAGTGEVVPSFAARNEASNAALTRASAEDALFEDLDGVDASEDGDGGSEAQEAAGEPQEASDGGSPQEPEVIPFDADDDGGSESEPTVYHVLIPPAEALAKARDVVMASPNGETQLKKAGTIWTISNDGGSLRIDVDDEAFPGGCVLAAQIAEAHARLAGVPPVVVSSGEPS